VRIAGSRVLITGAGRGLGLAIARSFGHFGARVLVTDIDSERVDKAVATLHAEGQSACGYVLDVTAADQVAAVRQRIEAEQGPIDILVNNAGIVFGGPFLNVPLERHMATVNVNLSGLLMMTYAFLPGLLGRPAAHIVNIASASAVLALPMATSYAASKWAVLGFTDSLREELRELGHRHIGVTAICPAYIATGLFDGANPARLTSWLTPEQVAEAVLRSVERNKEFVMLPWQARLFHSLCRGWPRSWFRAVCRMLGVSRSMTNWRGHEPPPLAR
jgi:short-subunit dehydrogenase